MRINHLGIVCGLHVLGILLPLAHSSLGADFALVPARVSSPSTPPNDSSLPLGHLSVPSHPNWNQTWGQPLSASSSGGYTCSPWKTQPIPATPWLRAFWCPQIPSLTVDVSESNCLMCHCSLLMGKFRHLLIPPGCLHYILKVFSNLLVTRVWFGTIYWFLGYNSQVREEALGTTLIFGVEGRAKLFEIGHLPHTPMSEFTLLAKNKALCISSRWEKIMEITV